MRGALRRWHRVARVRVRRWRAGVWGVLLAVVVAPAVARMATGSADAAFATLTNVVLWGSMLLAALLGSGGCGAQLRSGTASLWLQKPVRGGLFYLDRLVPRLVVVALSVLLLAGLGMLVAALTGSPAVPEDVRTLGLTMVFMSLTLVCMMYGLSGVGLPHEAVLTLFAWLALTMLALPVAESPELLGAALPLAEAASFPVDAVALAGRFLSGAPVQDGGLHVLRVASYGAGWVAVGTAGAALSTRSPIARGRE